MSDSEDDLQPSAMSLRALISPVVAVLLILAGVVLSVLLTGTGIQNEAEAVQSRKLIESAFRMVGRDLGRVAVEVARSVDDKEDLVPKLNHTWVNGYLSPLQTGFDGVGALAIDSDGAVLYRSKIISDAEISQTLRGVASAARKMVGADAGWTSSFVLHEGKLYVASASVVAPHGADSANAVVLMVLKQVDDALLARLSNDILIDNIKVQPASGFRGNVAMVITSPEGESLAAITWTPARPGDELFDYLLVPIVIASLIAALLLATFLRTAVHATRQLKRGAAALAESGEALEYSETMLSAIIHGVADGIITIDETGRITSANAAMSSIFGYQAEEILGEPADMLLAGIKDKAEKAESMLVAVRNMTETVYREFTGRRKDGSRFVLDTAISHTTYQSQAVAIVIMRDITERKQAEETLNLLATGMVLVDRDCRLLLANRSASRLLDSGDGLGLSHGRITASRRDQVDQLSNLVEKACTGLGLDDDDGAGVMTVDRGDGVRPLSIKVAPVQLSTGDNGSRAAAIFIRDLEVRQSVPPEVVAKLFGLTFAEARVVVELVKGKRPQEVSEDLGVSLNTVRNQLKQIFSKTNTGRQSELISLVLSSAAFVSEHGLEMDQDSDSEVKPAIN